MNSHCRTNKRICCRTTCFTDTMVMFKKNVGISQPKNAPPRALRSRFHNVYNKSTSRWEAIKTINPDTHTTLDNFFVSDGFGQPNSANRKQHTFNTSKMEKNDTSTTPNLQTNSKNKADQGKQKYKNGFMYKSQANVESNVGSMDRLQRLKAKQIRKYSPGKPLSVHFQTQPTYL